MGNSQGGREGRCRERVGQASDPSHQPGKEWSRKPLPGPRQQPLRQGESHGMEKSARHPGSGGAVSFFYPRGLTLRPGRGAKPFCLGEQAGRMGCWLKQTLTRSAGEVGLSSWGL